MRDDKPADIGMWATIIVIVCAITLLLFTLLWTGKAKSEELSEISVQNASFCSLFARAETFHDAMHGTDLTADSDYILARAKEHYGNCLATLPTLLPVSDDLKSWLADIRDLLVLTGRQRVADVGTAPAAASPSDEEWRRQCRAEYRTWNEEAGTVIRAGNPEPVRCPCMGEVTCGD